MTSQLVMDRRSIITSYVTIHPFSTLNKTWKNSGASKNWEDIKSDLDYLTRENLIKKANYGKKQVYFVLQSLNPFDRITANHLLLKDEVFSLIESIEQNRTKNKINSQEPSFEKTLEKLSSIYFLKVKILLLEYNKNKKFGDEFAINKKGVREGALVVFLLKFREFLSRYESKPDSRIPNYRELTDYLDRDYDEDSDYHLRLSKNALSMKELLATYFQYCLETKKDVSQTIKKTMKQVGNRIRSFPKRGSKPDYEAIYRRGMKEDGDNILYEPSDEVMLMNIDFFKKPVRTIPTVYSVNQTNRSN